MKFSENNNRFIMQNGPSTLWIEPWGDNSLRIRMTKEAVMDSNDWALCEPVPALPLQVSYETIDMTEPWYHTDAERQAHKQTGTQVTITNGKIKAVINPEGVISYYNENNSLLTKEYWRNRDRIDRFCVPLRIDARELKPITGTTDYRLVMRFEAFEDEKIFGMGQYQEDSLNKKGAMLELAHRNSQCSFYDFQPGVWFSVEQPSHRNRLLCHQQNRMDRREYEKTGLFHHCRRYPGAASGTVHCRNRKSSHDAGVWHGLLAM